MRSESGILGSFQAQASKDVQGQRGSANPIAGDVGERDLPAPRLVRRMTTAALQQSVNLLAALPDDCGERGMPDRPRPQVVGAVSTVLEFPRQIQVAAILLHDRKITWDRD